MWETERWCYAVKCNLTKNGSRIDAGDKYDCAADCYLSKTDLLWKNKTFNRQGAKDIYLTNSKLYRKHFGDEWTEVIESAFKNVKFLGYYDDALNISDFLNNFFSSIDGYLKAHCPLNAIEETDECDEVEEQYEKCLNFTPNCTAQWPARLLMPEFCCEYPELFSILVKEECHSDCNQMTMQRERAECYYECIYNSTGIRSDDGKYDFEVVKSLLIENSSKGYKWGPAIDTSVDVCQKLVEGEDR